ncbi:nucleoside-diphosphate sugar epimerase/dehydratase, partial [Staphylococcus aureus]|uniref:nucleoside-diphosphate sugar epimerase/dehydratase n=1 Tax=Staphylococcus aureus TaxID=1280 RepID=UPI0035CCC8FA
LGGKSFNKKPTLVVGAGQAGSMLIRQLLKSDEMKLEPVLASEESSYTTGQVFGVSGGVHID